MNTNSKSDSQIKYIQMLNWEGLLSGELKMAKMIVTI